MKFNILLRVVEPILPRVRRDEPRYEDSRRRGRSRYLRSKFQSSPWVGPDSFSAICKPCSMIFKVPPREHSNFTLTTRLSGHQYTLSKSVPSHPACLPEAYSPIEQTAPRALFVESHIRVGRVLGSQPDFLGWYMWLQTEPNRLITSVMPFEERLVSPSRWLHHSQP